MGGNMIFLLPLLAAATSATEIIGTTIGAIGIGCALKGASDSKHAKEIVRTSNKLKEDEEVEDEDFEEYVEETEKEKVEDEEEVEEEEAY